MRRRSHRAANVATGSETQGIDNLAIADVAAGPTSPQESSTPELSPFPYFDAERLVLDADTSWDRVKIIWERARRSSVAS